MFPTPHKYFKSKDKSNPISACTPIRDETRVGKGAGERAGYPEKGGKHNEPENSKEN